MFEDTSWFIWARLVCGCLAAWYVNKDAQANELPNRNFWVVICFIFFPLVLAYQFYKDYAKRRGNVSTLAQRQMELEQKHLETRQRLRAEREAWERERRQQMALNRKAEKELEKEIEAERQKRAAAHKKRMKELAEERELQQEAAAKALHIK